MKRMLLCLTVLCLFVFSCEHKTTETPDYQPCATPVINPSGGTYIDELLVQITCSTPGATVVYTLDGSEPGPSTPVSHNPFSIGVNTTVRAMAFKDGWLNSEEAAAEFVFEYEGIVEDPVINPGSGLYTSELQVTVTCATPGAVIRLGAVNIFHEGPLIIDTTSALYTGPITIFWPGGYGARAFKPGWRSSNLVGVHYDLQVAPLTVSPPEGTYSAPIAVTLTSVTPFSEIHYTTDGSEPTDVSPYGFDPVLLHSDTVLKAKGYKDDWLPSETLTATYTFTPPPKTRNTPARLK